VVTTAAVSGALKASGGEQQLSDTFGQWEQSIP
jgi:hypothetical protein